VLDGGGVVVNDANRQGTRLHPTLTGEVGNADVQKEDVGARDLLGTGPRRLLVGRDGEEVDARRLRVLLKSGVGNVGGHPAVDAVAMEGDGVADGSVHSRKEESVGRVPFLSPPRPLQIFLAPATLCRAFHHSLRITANTRIHPTTRV